MEEGVFLKDPFFFPSVQRSIVEKNVYPKDSLGFIFDLLGEVELSYWYDLSRIQDSFRFRLKRRVLLLASYLVEEDGSLNPSKLDHVISLLKEGITIVSPGGFCDTQALEHTRFVLTRLRQDPSFFRVFNSFQTPLCHEWAEQLIRESLGGFKESVSECHVKRAVLSALLTPLRQNVGSCFATAPAILIQKEQVEYLLLDLLDLLMTGRLTRTVRGIESSAPLSPTSGSGDLYRKVNPRSVHTSPGLMAALSAANVFPEERKLSEKSEELKSLLEKVFEKNELIQISDVIHKVLLLHYELQEKDVEKYLQNHRSFLRSKKMIKTAQKGRFEEMNQRVEKLLLFEEKAKAAFKACTDHALLKAWEFTLASFSESKMEFSGWNLYSSLGLHPSESGGIGEVIYKALEKEHEVNQEKLEICDREYHIAYDQVRMTEGLLSRAGSESEAKRLQAELTIRVRNMREQLEKRDALEANAAYFSEFLPFLLKQYDERFPEYFQEIYDANLQDVQVKAYEDSAAGFRLVYKHGRSNASLWTMIYDEEAYVEALVDFFLLTENQIAAGSSWELASQVLERVTTGIVSHLRTPEFVKTACIRAKKVHKQRGEGGKPWAYLSGGSMATLLQSYYSREQVITEETKRVGTPTDLLVFIIDTLRLIKAPLEGRDLLMNSPTHAFILHPEFKLLKEAVEDNLFSYSWARDNVIYPRKRFYEGITLSQDEQLFLIEEFCKDLPTDATLILKGVALPKEVSLQEFRIRILERLPPAVEENFDSFMYEMIPLIPASRWKQVVKDLLSDFTIPHLDPLLEKHSDLFSDFFGLKQIKEIAKAFYLLLEEETIFSFDLHEVIGKKAEKLEYAPPAPFLFADTNWSQYFFGFIVNPGTLELELWRVEPYGRAAPMTTWKRYFNESTLPSWTICSKPFEYRF